MSLLEMLAMEPPKGRQQSPRGARPSRPVDNESRSNDEKKKTLVGKIAARMRFRSPRVAGAAAAAATSQLSKSQEMQSSTNFDDDEHEGGDEESGSDDDDSGREMSLLDA